MNRRVASLAVALLLALAMGPAVLADAKDLYREGRDALAAREWSKAIRLFESAIAERPEPKAKSFLGREYLPHFGLGMARLGAGDCLGALASFQEAERYGEIQKEAEDFGELKKGERRCRERLEAFASELDELDERQREAEAAASALDDFAATPAVAAVWEEGDPPFSERRGWIGELLEQAAASREEAARLNAESRLVDADRQIEEATAEIEKLESEVRSRLAARTEARADDIRENLSQLSSSARRILGSVEDLAPYPEQLGRRVDLVRSLRGRAEAVGDDAPVAELEQLRQDLRSAVGSLRVAARPPPDPLIEKADAFLAGRYGEVLVEDPETDASWRDDPRAEAFACWIEAAAEHATSSVVHSAEDEPLRQRIRACQALDVEVTLPATYVSPAFLDLWSEVAAETAAAEAEDAETEDGPAAEGEAGADG